MAHVLRDLRLAKRFSILIAFAFVLLSLPALLSACSVADPPQLAIVPDGSDVTVGTTLQLVATRHYLDGTVENISELANWTSSNTALAKVDQNGLFTAVSPTAAPNSIVYISAHDPVSGVTITSSFTVTPSVLRRIDVAPSPASILAPGQSFQFTANGTYSDGSNKDITTTVLWATENEGVASVSNLDPTRGVVTAGINASGTTSVTATDPVSGVIGSTLVFVAGNPATLVALSIDPNPESVDIGQTSQYIATAIFSDGTTHDETATVQWSSSNPTLATIDSTGVAKGIAAGSVTITATAPGTAVRASGALTITTP